MKNTIKQDIVRKVTQFFHCMGTTCSGWATCAAALRRCQVHDKKQFGTKSWNDYPSDRWGWITDTGRCVGVGCMPTKNLIGSNELLISVPLPFEGSGRDLRRHTEKFVKKMNKALRR